ncbi:MAG: nucleotide exchange factor GrpE [Ignavibacteriota bacterium]
MSDEGAAAAEATRSQATSELASQGEGATREPPTNISPIAETAEETTGHSQELSELARAMEESNRISAERERVIDKLYEDNQRLRAGELQQALMPVLRDLMRLYDDLNKTATAYSGRTSIDPGEVLREWEYYRDSILDILYRQGVEPCATTEGSSFDPREHRACGTVSTNEHHRDRTIARVIRVGFRTEARILRTPDVEVYRASIVADTVTPS